LAFSRAIGSTTSVTMELWDLRDGLKLCLDLYLYAVEVDVDALLVVNWVSNPNCINITHFSLIMDCRELLNLIPQVKVKHCYHEANQCADFLAKHGATSQKDFIIFNSPLLNYVYSFFMILLVCILIGLTLLLTLLN
jgi:ribonuclease HI